MKYMNRKAILFESRNPYFPAGIFIVLTLIWHKVSTLVTKNIFILKNVLPTWQHTALWTLHWTQILHLSKIFRPSCLARWYGKNGNIERNFIFAKNSIHRIAKIIQKQKKWDKIDKYMSNMRVYSASSVSQMSYPRNARRK